MAERRYPSGVPTLAEIVRAARGQKSQVAFERDTGISVKVLRNFEKGRRVEPESLAALVSALPEHAEAIARAVAEAAETSRPVVYRHTDERGAVRLNASGSLTQPLGAPAPEDDLLFPLDPVKSAVVQIYDGLSDRARLEALTAMGEIAQRDRLRSPVSKDQA